MQIGRFMSLKNGATQNKKAAAVGGISAMGVLGAGVDGFSTYYFDQMENPDSSPLMSAAKGAAVGAGWLFAEPLMWGITIGQGVNAIGKELYEEGRQNLAIKRQFENKVKPDGTGAMAGTLGGNFIDTDSAYTMRQRQMNLMKQHRISTEAILGSEARQLHR